MRKILTRGGVLRVTIMRYKEKKLLISVFMKVRASARGRSVFERFYKNDKATGLTRPSGWGFYFQNNNLAHNQDIWAEAITERTTSLLYPRRIPSERHSPITDGNTITVYHRRNDMEEKERPESGDEAGRSNSLKATERDRRKSRSITELLPTTRPTKPRRARPKPPLLPGTLSAPR